MDIRLALLSLLALPLIANASIEDLLAKIKIEDEIAGDDYNREVHFGDWIDEDCDGYSTRQEVLEQESLIPVTYDRKVSIVKPVR